MFEKEAEQYATIPLPDGYEKIDFQKKEDWQKGAEYGYNKANEWHYPSKDELPKCDEETQLIFYVNCYYEVGGETLIRKRTARLTSS